MKKVLLLIILCLLVGATADAQKGNRKPAKAKAKTAATYKVEKSHEVYCNGNCVLEGTTLSANNTIEIKDNGFLMIVNTSAKKRYYISKAKTAKVADIVKEVTKPKSVSKYYLESLMTEKQNSNDYSNSYGNVLRKPTPVYLDDVKTDKNGEIKVYMIADEEE
ncbi:MAG: hypothetical protein J5629_07420 [Muribaculaceae bacterium]|nr:hypothetical protein [Muribaculaceae bacterium]